MARHAYTSSSAAAAAAFNIECKYPTGTVLCLMRAERVAKERDLIELQSGGKVI